MVRKWSFWCGLLLEGMLHVSLCMGKHWQAQKFAAEEWCFGCCLFQVTLLPQQHPLFPNFPSATFTTSL